MKKISFMIIVFQLVSCGICAQTEAEQLNISLSKNALLEKKFPEDTNAKYRMDVPRDELSFMLDENNYYSFYINDMIPIQSGILIDAYSYSIYPYQIHAVIISPYKRMYTSTQRIPIKIGKTYSFSVKRYNKTPCGIHPEKGDVIDVLLGDSIYSVECRGLFTYLFVSLDLSNKRFRRNENLTSQIQKFNSQKKEIMDVVTKFINIVTYENDIENILPFIDTIKIKETFLQYGFPFFNYQSDSVSLYPAKVKKTMDWNYYGCSNNENSLSMLRNILRKDFKFPLHNIAHEQITKIDIDLLYMDKKNYTIRVDYLVQNNTPISMVLNVSRDKDEFKISGINRKLGL